MNCCKESKMSKADSLMYITDLCPETVAKMKDIRAKFVTLAKDIEALGESREMSLCFTAIEQAQMYAIKHLCMVCPTGKPIGLAEDLSDTPSWQGKVVGTIGHCGAATGALDGSAA